MMHTADDVHAAVSVPTVAGAMSSAQPGHEPVLVTALSAVSMSNSGHHHHQCSSSAEVQQQWPLPYWEGHTPVLHGIYSTYTIERAHICAAPCAQARRATREARAPTRVRVRSAHIYMYALYSVAAAVYMCYI